MELLRLTKFKLQLQALVSEVRELRKQKQSEEEFSSKLQQLQAALASSNEEREKLERKVSYLESDNALLEKREKELKGTIQTLLQSREKFVNVYKDSTCELKRSIESKDRKIKVMSDKINAHLLLFESIEKEASSVKQVVNDAQHLVNEKEELGMKPLSMSRLKSRMDNLLSCEGQFVEKISDLECRLKSNQEELRKKDKIISELDICYLLLLNFLDLPYLQKILSVKEAIIENLLSDNEALRFELGSLGFTLKKIQDSATNMSRNTRIGDGTLKTAENSPDKNCGREAIGNTASSPCQEHNALQRPSHENHCYSYAVEITCSPPPSTSSEPQTKVDAQSILINGTKDNCRSFASHIDSENSTTQVDMTEAPE
ncbi:hypothetical protein RJ641_012606 [Dillenia turbinata]|uniref:Uncharacterized protein n=1 Tax=Dillenia turbinata TaxID=194707 RepID=A0AAN8UZJ6_9MAGN